MTFGQMFGLVAIAFIELFFNAWRQPALFRCKAKFLEPSGYVGAESLNLLNGCSENTKTALLDSMYVFLKRPEFSKYTNELGSVSPRILLTGPLGKMSFPTLNFPPVGNIHNVLTTAQ